MRRREPPVVSSVRPDSPAAQAGVLRGDALLRLNGERLADAIDYMELSLEERCSLRLRRGNRRFRARVDKRYGEPLGLGFDSAVFDGVRRCANNCSFCFVNNLPPGLRPGLYVRDDDYRLSFLAGNFISLTNVGPADVDRIIGSHLSPLYVSLHATQPELRERIFGNPRAAAALDTLRLLLEAGIEVHLQVVVAPGLNDGASLARTLADVAADYPAAASTGVVPVGYTRFAPARLPRVGPAQAGAILDQVADASALFKAAHGRSMFFASDELYLKAGRDLPEAAAYEDYPQLHNGIGMARRFLEETRCAYGSHALEGTLVATGTLAGPVLREAAAAAGLGDIMVLEVPNRLLGEEVTVAGLMSGADISYALKESGAAPERVLLPESTVSEGRFLDGWQLAELADEAGVMIETIETDGGLFAAAARGEI
ncbi:MAG: DUF512 domain-containing protein [Candidatus Geothermincolia bacterium]